MSVLIKGIDMPHSCWECPFEKCVLRALVDRHPDCPLVEVPFPHGRLIDGVGLLKTIAENAYLVKHGYNEMEYGMTCFGIMQAISEAPTIIEAEEGEEE